MVIFIKKLMRLKKQQKLNYVECFYFMCFILIQIKKKIYYFYLKKLFLFIIFGKTNSKTHIRKKYNKLINIIIIIINYRYL